MSSGSFKVQTRGRALHLGRQGEEEEDRQEAGVLKSQSLRESKGT